MLSGVLSDVMPEDEARTPGQLIESLALERGWTKRVLALVLGLDESRLTRILNGRQPLDVATALAVGEVLDVPAERLLSLQQKYDLARARLVTRADPARLTRAKLFGAIPVTEMLKRRWIRAENVRDIDAVSAELLKFFEVDSIEAIATPRHAAKRANDDAAVTPLQVAWLYRAQQLANSMLAPAYEPGCAERAIARLKDLLLSAEEARKVPRIMSECGIRFVVVESLPGAKMDGACFWLGDHSPVVAIAIRYDRIDHFWFVLRHELEHVRLGHGKTVAMLDFELEGERAGTGATVGAEEQVANAAAAEFCVPQKRLADFIARKAPLFAERDVLAFAKTVGVHPGLVTGQLQRQTGRYNFLRKHQVKIRTIVAPGAMVDGWGDVAPVGEE